jgi:plasmid maintenance system killer protein
LKGKLAGFRSIRINQQWGLFSDGKMARSTK